VAEAIGQDVADVRIGEAVIHDASLLPARHDPSIAQQPQLM